ncbi:728_t:CDS:2, partial [Dentiscutata heterogama]
HPKTIADYNYTYKVDWTEVNKNVNYYIEEKALCLHDKENKFILFYLIQHDEFNTRNYNSIIAVVKQFEIEKLAISLKNFKSKRTSSDISLIFNTLQCPKEHRISTTSASISLSTSSLAISVSTSASLFASTLSILALSKTVVLQNKKKDNIPKEPQVIIEPILLTITTTKKTAISKTSTQGAINSHIINK